MLETITTSPVLRFIISGTIASQTSTTPVAKSVFSFAISSFDVVPTRAARVMPAFSTKKSALIAASMTLCTPTPVLKSATITWVCASNF